MLQQGFGFFLRIIVRGDYKLQFLEDLVASHGLACPAQQIS